MAKRAVCAPRVLCLGEALVDRLGPLGGDPATATPAAAGASSSANEGGSSSKEASRQHAALLALLDEVGGDEAYERLWFNFRHITDELVFYGMGAQ